MLSIVEPHLPRSGYFWRNQAGALGSPLFFTIWGIYWDILGLFLSQVGIWYDDMIWRPQLWWNIITYHHWWQPFVSWNCTPKIPKHSIPLGSSCKSSFFCAQAPRVAARRSRFHPRRPLCWIRRGSVWKPCCWKKAMLRTTKGSGKLNGVVANKC